MQLHFAIDTLTKMEDVGYASVLITEIVKLVNVVAHVRVDHVHKLRV